MAKARKHLLVIDDEAGIRSALSEFAKRFGFKVTAVGRAEEALNLAKIQPFTMALVDCMLPRQNGVDLVEELRKAQFGQTPVILMSGVFRDKSFSAEAIKRTGAIEFLYKPVDFSLLQKIFDKQVKDNEASDQVPLHVLVSKHFSTARERLKVIEGLEEIKGFDLPFVLSVLIDAAASGHLNIVNSKGEVFGITFANGKIVKADSSESAETSKRLLLEKGYVTNEDLRSAGLEKVRGDIVNLLVEQHYISPHALPIIRKEQMLSDLRRLFVLEIMQSNFVPDQVKSHEIHLNMEDLSPLLYQVAEKILSIDHLRNFYQQWLDHPIRVGATFKADHPLFQLPLLAKLKQLPSLLGASLTIDEICVKGQYNQEDLLKAIHFLTLHRLIVFNEIKKVGNVEDHAKRVESMLMALEGRNPFAVFEYFGATAGANEVEVGKIYKEFARANHPDLLPGNIDKKIRDGVNRVFSIVSEAHNILINPDKRKKLVQEIKQKEAERQIRGEQLIDEAINFLRRGQVSLALPKAKEAYDLSQTRGIKLSYCWALLKNAENKETVAEVEKILETISAEDRRVVQFAFVNGLLLRIKGDIEGAVVQLDRAIQADPNYIEARRERTALEGLREEKTDIFNADLTKIVGNFFKKR